MLEKIKGYWSVFISHFSISSNRKVLGLIGLIVVVAAVPLTVLIAQQQQNIRQRAAGFETTPPYTTLPYTTLPFPPTSTPPPTATSSITVLSPNGGEKWEIGKTYDVTWNYSGPSDCTVSVYLFNYKNYNLYGGNNLPIPASLNKYSFIVSTNVPPGENIYKVEVNGGKCGFSDQSDNHLSIASPTPTPKPSFTVLSPNGGEQLVRGKSYPITWKSTGNSSKVKISLYRLGQYRQLLTAYDVANTGSWNWPFSPEMPPVSNYSIRISDVSFPNIWDDSDRTFSIVDGCTACTADVNKDKIVNNKDTAIVKSCINKPIKGACVNADTTQDGKINAIDSNCVLRKNLAQCP